MENTLQEIKHFLSAPSEHKDAFWDSAALVWVDWGEFDESIIDYFNERLPDEAKIDYAYVEIKKERGVDILLKKNGLATPIPYAEDRTDRDTTLQSIQAYLSPDYKICWYMDSLGSDTLAFCVLPAAQWNQLVQEFGLDIVHFYFAPVQTERNMFEMDLDEMFDLLEQRKNYKFR